MVEVSMNHKVRQNGLFESMNRAEVAVATEVVPKAIHCRERGESSESKEVESDLYGDSLDRGFLGG